MVLLRKVVQKGKNLVGITTSGEEIPIVEDLWFQTERNHGVSDFETESIRQLYKDKVDKTLDEIEGYFQVGNIINENHDRGKTTIPYIRYKKIPQ